MFLLYKLQNSYIVSVQFLLEIVYFTTEIIIFMASLLTQGSHKQQHNLNYTVGIIWDIFHTEFQRCEIKKCSRCIFLKGTNKKNTSKLLKIVNIPVISVVSSTKNEFVAVQEDVTLYGHCSKHLKYSERKHYNKMCDHRRVNITSLTSQILSYLRKNQIFFQE